MVYRKIVIAFCICSCMLTAHLSHSQKLDSVLSSKAGSVKNPPYWFELGFGGVSKTAWWNFGGSILVRKKWVLGANYMIANRDPYHVFQRFVNHTNSSAVSISVGLPKQMSPRIKLILSAGPALNTTKEFQYVLSGNKPAMNQIQILLGQTAPINSGITSRIRPALKVHAQVVVYSRSSGFGFHPYLIVDAKNIYGGFTCNFIFWAGDAKAPKDR